MARKILKSTFLLFCTVWSGLLLTYAQHNIAVGQWRVHLPYRPLLHLSDAEDQVFASAPQGLYSVSMPEGEIKIWSKQDGLSDIGVSAMAFNPQGKDMVIGYKSGLLDVIRKDGRVFGLNDIARNQILQDKQVNHIFINEGLAYISCNFGLIIMDLSRREFKESCTEFTGKVQAKIFNSAVLGDQLYCNTDEGIFRVNKAAPTICDPTNWEQIEDSAATCIGYAGNKLYAAINGTLREYNPTNKSWQILEGNGTTYASMKQIANQELLIATSTGFLTVRADGSRTLFPEALANEVIRNQEGYWVASFQGLIRISNAGNYDFFTPNCPVSINTYQMKVLDQTLWVATGGINVQQPMYLATGIMSYKEGSWRNYRESSHPILDTVQDIVCVERTSDGKVYFGSYQDGLLELTNGEVSNIFSEANTGNALRRAVSGNPPPLYIAGLAADQKGNLWVSNSSTQEPLVVRTAAGQWNRISLRGVTQGTNDLRKMIVDEDGKVWVICYGKGIVVYDPQDNPANPLNPIRLISTAVDQGALPSVDVKCLLKSANGDIWIGTQSGLVVISNPEDVFSNPQKNFDAKKIQVGVGKNAGFLLDGEEITDMVADGGDRKWITTRNGVFLVSPDGSTIIQQFTRENSPLLNNNVNNVAYNELNGEVFFGTQDGICSYRSDATQGGNTNGTVLVFPNPVRPDFSGVITISGLLSNANVKITDISGRVVYETVSNGGTATWSGTNFSGERVSTGVYLVFSAKDDGTESNVAKILFVNGE